MKFTFIANACGVFSGSEGTRLLCDPWVKDGVFEGSWCHFPKLQTSIDDLKDVDAIYISHIHPDHFDERTFTFNRDIPILLLDHGANFLQRRLQALGFSNLLMVKDGESLKFKEFTFTLFAPFEKHNFHEAKVGNLIDSALVISDAEHCILNANDNTPSTESARQVRDRFGDLDLVMLNYNAAGPYPSCFTNLTIEQRLSEHSRILSRNFDHISALLEVFQSRAFLPFAGAYVIGGSQWEKNAYLGTTTWDVCREEVLSRRPSENILVMREMQTLDLESLTLDSAYEPLDVHHMREYIESELSSLVYPYELDSEPDLGLLVADLRIAARRGAERSARFGLRTSFRALIEVGSEMVQVVDPECAGLHSHERELVCRLDPRLLRRILDRRAHWNNAEIGCHINFDRRPNEYDPDLHTILQFVHL